jgi:hypothetical protein
VCAWPKCEHIESPTDFSIQTQFHQLGWIFNNGSTPKINIFRTLALKIVKWTLLNLTHRGLSKNNTNSPKIPIKFSVLILFNFHWEKGSIFNSFHAIAPNSLKPTKSVHLYSSRAFRRYQECNQECNMKLPWFGRSQHDNTKQNKKKLHCFIDR